MKENALQDVLEAILPLADSLARALGAARETEGAQQIAEGLELVEREFYAALEKLGVEPIDAVGEPFDPHYHEAVMQEPTDLMSPGLVLRELKRGFQTAQRVLRPSLVIVAAEPNQGADH
jgi:molecular chaperone GrpE